MILLLIAVVSLMLFTMFLSYRVDELEFEKKLVQIDADMYNKLYETEKHYTELYWSHYNEEQRKNRSKALLIKELQEENTELEGLLAHKELELDNANEWADGWEEAYNRVLEEWKVALKEKEELEERNKWLQYELENEFEWSMLYSESVDKYARLYDEALEECSRLEGELEQTQETLNMLEYGYELLVEEKEALEDKVDELETYIMETEYGDDM